MKELLIDFTMVGLLLFCMNGLLNNHYIQNEMVSKNIVAFEQDVKKQKEIKKYTRLWKIITSAWTAVRWGSNIPLKF